MLHSHVPAALGTVSSDHSDVFTSWPPGYPGQAYKPQASLFSLFVALLRSAVSEILLHASSGLYTSSFFILPYALWP